MKILSGTSNPRLSNQISKQLKLKLINTNIKRFADGEIYIEINENINFDTFSEKKNFFSFRRSKKAKEKDYGRCISIISLIK